MIERLAPAIALASAIAIAGCGGNAPVDEMPGATWARVHAAIDSLGAQDQVEAALQVVAAARALPHPPEWLAADLAASAASLQRRAALPAPAREAARTVDERALRVPELLEHDSLTVAHRLAREVVEARSRSYPPGHPILARSLMRLAEVEFHLGRGGEADSLAREVLAHVTVGPDSLHPLVADAEQMVGRVIKNFSGARFRDDVMRHYQRALRIRERIDGPQSLTVAAIHHDLGNLERQAKRPDDAIGHFRHALEIRRAILGPHHEEVASTLSAIAWLSASRGDWPSVERDMRAALVAVPESALTAPSVLALRTGLLGQALRRMGRTSEAIVSLRTAVAAVESMWVRVPHDGEGSVQAGLSIHRELALALAAEGHAEEAFEHVERSQLRLWVPDAPAGGWARVLPRVQRALPGDAALVLWPRTSLFPPGGDYPMWACVVRRTGRPAWVRIERTSGWPQRGTPPREALNRELAHAAQWPLRVSDTRAIDSLAAVMGTELLTPIEPLLRGVSRLVVSGPDLMAWTPLSMLRDANGVRLMDRFVISYVPSALAYADLAERTTAVPTAHSERALLVGAPAPGRDDATRWPPLTGAADELSGLSRLFPEATVLTGSDATAGRLDALAHSGALDRYGVVHFAAHIDLNPARVLQSAFVLAPDRPGDPRGSRLTAARIAGQWHVHAGIVSLAGCHSAIGLYSASEGWLGMYSAFLAAGAPCLLVSLWQVDDEATRRLMIEFHTRLLAQTGARDPAQALRAAQRAVREYRAGDGTRPFAHPAYWAGFAVVGRG